MSIDVDHMNILMVCTMACGDWVCQKRKVCLQIQQACMKVFILFIFIFLFLFLVLFSFISSFLIHEFMKLTFSIFNKISGEWVDGKLVGSVCWKSANGDVYEGEWSEGRMDGMGKHQNVGGDVYVGMFRENKRHGKGQMNWSNGNEYIGMWEENYPNGNGRLLFNQNQSMYKGTFKRGLFHGLGKLSVIEDDGREEGREEAKKWWEEELGRRGGGKGESEKKVGTYHGEWRDGLRCGNGVCIGLNGVTYNGEWWKNFPNGKGVMTDEHGNRYSGQWEQGRFHGVGKLELANGVVYEGEFAMGLRHGRSSIQKHTSVYEFCGGFKLGLAHGLGRLTVMLVDGSTATAEGEWRNGMKCGRFSVHFGDKEGRTVYFGDDVVDGGWSEQLNIFHIDLCEMRIFLSAPPFF
jgi:hypothetical protein